MQNQVLADLHCGHRVLALGEDSGYMGKESIGREARNVRSQRMITGCEKVELIRRSARNRGKGSWCLGIRKPEVAFQLAPISTPSKFRGAIAGEHGEVGGYRTILKGLPVRIE